MSETSSSWQSIAILVGRLIFAAVFIMAAAFKFIDMNAAAPSLWKGNQAEFGFFINHFTFFAGLLFAAVHGPGRILALPHTIIGRR